MPKRVVLVTILHKLLKRLSRNTWMQTASVKGSCYDILNLAMKFRSTYVNMVKRNWIKVAFDKMLGLFLCYYSFLNTDHVSLTSSSLYPKTYTFNLSFFRCLPFLSFILWFYFSFVKVLLDRFSFDRFDAIIFSDHLLLKENWRKTN